MPDISTNEKSGLGERGARYRSAGVVYFLLGVVIMAITVASPGLLAPERRADLVHLLVGLPFFAVFALLVAYGDRVFGALARVAGASSDRTGRIGRWVQEKLVMLLTLSALGRTAVFAANGVGFKPGLSLRPFAFAMATVPPNPRMLLNAVLMAVIVVVLARASWLPFLRRGHTGTSVT